MFSPEAMNDLIAIMSQLSDVNGSARIPGLMELVAPMTEEEKKVYSSIDFCRNQYMEDMGAYGLLKETKEELLMARWRYPSLSLHGIEGAFSGHGAKTVIPAKVNSV